MTRPSCPAGALEAVETASRDERRALQRAPEGGRCAARPTMSRTTSRCFDAAGVHPGTSRRRLPIGCACVR